MSFTNLLKLIEEFKVNKYHLTLSILYCFAAVLSAILNLLVVVSILRTPSLRKPSILLLVNLALTDLLAGLVSHPLMAVIHLAVFEDQKIILIARYSFFVIGSVSISTMAAISVDRLLAIKLKMNYRIMVTKKKVGLVLVAIWIVNVGTGILLYILSHIGAAEGILLAVGGSILLIIITVSYSLAYYNLKKMPCRICPRQPSQTQSFNVLTYRKSFFTMFLVFIILVLSYLPYFICVSISVMFFYQNSFSTQRMLYIFFTSSEVVIAFNSVINPLFYLWRMKDIRSAVRRTVMKILRNGNGVPDSLETTR